MNATVSVILPTLNEQPYIKDCLDSLLAQDYDDILEILVVDGGSTDATRAIVEAVAGRVRLIPNPGVTAASAMNLGIAESKGDVIVRADAHTLYAHDYVSRCVAVLQETGADNVGGRMRPVGTTAFGRAVAAVTSSPLGVGPGRFHYHEERSEVDTVYLGCWRRQTLEALGGYDDVRLQWGAEDQELNFRLRAGGGRIVLDPTIRAWYFPRDNRRALWRQYFNYGLCKASTLEKHRSLPSPRPLAPAVFVAAAGLAAARGRGWRRILLPLAHLAAVVLAVVKLQPEEPASPVLSVEATVICHWSYGLGFWSGIGRIVRGKPFDSRPGGHR